MIFSLEMIRFLTAELQTSTGNKVFGGGSLGN
jgi:hypothetical protein